jgi:putative transcriptional regulator
VDAIRDSRIACSKRERQTFIEHYRQNNRRDAGFQVNGIRDSRIKTSLELLIMQNSSWRRDEGRRQRNQAKRTRPTKLREQLRAWRRKHGLSQSEAGLKLQISRRTLQEWEQGRAMPRGLALIALRQVLGR